MSKQRAVALAGCAVPYRTLMAALRDQGRSSKDMSARQMVDFALAFEASRPPMRNDRIAKLTGYAPKYALKLARDAGLRAPYTVEQVVAAVRHRTRELRLAPGRKPRAVSVGAVAQPIDAWAKALGVKRNTLYMAAMRRGATVESEIALRASAMPQIARAA